MIDVTRPDQKVPNFSLTSWLTAHWSNSQPAIFCWHGLETLCCSLPVLPGLGVIYSETNYTIEWYMVVLVVVMVVNSAKTQIVN